MGNFEFLQPALKALYKSAKGPMPAVSNGHHAKQRIFRVDELESPCILNRPHKQ